MALLHREHHDDGNGTVGREQIRQEVTERPVSTRTSERFWDFAPGQLVSLIAGVGVLIVGIVAVIRAGVEGSLSRPLVEVAGYTHTAWLGIAEIGLGLLLLLAGTGAWGRGLSVLLGAASVVAGALVLAVPEDMPEELGLEKDFGWPLLILGAVVALAALALPVWRSRKVDHKAVGWRDEPDRV
jgi:hypothetical protein